MRAPPLASARSPIARPQLRKAEVPDAEPSEPVCCMIHVPAPRRAQRSIAIGRHSTALLHLVGLRSSASSASAPPPRRPPVDRAPPPRRPPLLRLVGLRSSASLASAPPPRRHPLDRAPPPRWPPLLRLVGLRAAALLRLVGLRSSASSASARPHSSSSWPARPCCRRRRRPPLGRALPPRPGRAQCERSGTHVGV